MRIPSLELIRCHKSVGNKASMLGRMAAAGIPVPPAVVIPSSEFCGSRLMDRCLDELCRAASSLSCGYTCPLICRSSATVEDGDTRSYAGLFTTVSNVWSFPGVILAAEAIISSSERAVPRGYESREGPPRMAVVVQKMVLSRAAGVAFTRTAEGYMCIEAVLAHGEALVQGMASPRRYLLDRYSDRTVVDIQGAYRGLMAVPLPPGAHGATVGSALADGRFGALRVNYVDHESAMAFCEVPSRLQTYEILSPREISALRECCRRIEALLGGPADIEWAIDNEGNLWILQARPVTVVPSVTAGSGSLGTLEGTVASPGVARGTVFRAADGAQETSPGNVLIDHFVTPSHLSSVLSAVAVVTEELGILSHTAILCRELKIPCLTGVDGAVEAYPPGSRVLVDAGGNVGAVRPDDCNGELPAPIRREDVESAESDHSRLLTLLARRGVPIALEQAVTDLVWESDLSKPPTVEGLLRCVRREVREEEKVILWAQVAGDEDTESSTSAGAVGQGELLIWREWINNLTTEGTGFAFLDKLLQVDRLIDLGLVFSDAETLSSMLATALAYMSLSCRTRIHIFIREEESVGVQKRCGLTVEDGDAGWVVYACPPSHADRKGADYDGG